MGGIRKEKREKPVFLRQMRPCLWGDLSPVQGGPDEAAPCSCRFSDRGPCPCPGRLYPFTGSWSLQNLFRRPAGNRFDMSEHSCPNYASVLSLQLISLGF